MFRGITDNYLNLPQTVTHSGGSVNYTYSASGQKLKADFGGGKSYDYVAGLVYAGSQLEFIPTGEGRVLPPGLASTTITAGGSATAANSYYRYEYQLKDHLGNLRVACRCGEKANETSPSDTYGPLVVQEQHYDPYGLDLTGLTTQPGLTANRFKYNGKEEQAGLGWIDYGARMYDPTIGRWNGVDEMIEKWTFFSPYSYAINNPMKYVDVDGSDIVPVISNYKDKNGTYITSVSFNVNVAVIQAPGSYKVTNLKNIANGISNKLQKAFKGEYNVPGSKFIFKPGKINVEVVDDASKVKSDQHLIVVVDDVVGKTANGKGESSEMAGQAKFGAKTAYVEAGDPNEAEISVHELGHNFGLEHNWLTSDSGDDAETNFMSYGQNRSGFSGMQLLKILRGFQAGNLNKGKTTKRLQADDHKYNETTQKKPYSSGAKNTVVPIPVNESGNN